MFQPSHFLERNASKNPSGTGLVFKGREYPWQELDLQASRLARGLAQRGIAKGDMVAFYMRNCLEAVVIWWASQKLGAIAQPLNIYLMPHEIIRCLQISGSRVLFYDGSEQAVDKTGQILAGSPQLQYAIPCSGDTEGSIEFQALLASESEEPFRTVALDEGDPSLLLFTSGTTGLPKGVIRSQRIVVAYARLMARENQDAAGSETVLTACPLFHTAGLSILMKAAALGATLILFDRFDAEGILKAIEAYRATQIMVVPPSLYKRLVLKCRSGYDLSSIREAQCSGGKVTVADLEHMRSLFPAAELRFSWGATETCVGTSCRLSYHDLEMHPERCSTVGKPASTVELKIVDDRGAVVEKGMVGEALVRSPLVFSGYYNDQAGSASVLSKDGWFNTGDLLKEDEHGFYYLVDRKKDMVKSGGENVYTQEVERVVSEFSGITECAAIGVPDQCFGEAVAVVIATDDGCEIDVDALIGHCKERMASYKKPRYLAYMDALPRNSIGKIQKSILKEKPDTFFQPLFDRD